MIFNPNFISFREMKFKKKKIVHMYLTDAEATDTYDSFDEINFTNNQINIALVLKKVILFGIMLETMMLCKLVDKIFQKVGIKKLSL